MSRALMTIHGFLTDSDDFGILYDNLAGYDHIHRCTVPGHGEGADMSLFAVDSVIEHVTQQFDLLASQYDSVDVVGYSMGGALTSYLCAVRPVNRAVMLAPSNLYINANAIGRWILYLLQQARDPLMESNGTIATKIKFTQRHLAEDLDNLERSVGMAGSMLSRISLASYMTFSKLMKHCNKTIENICSSSSIDVPALIIMGGLDELVPHKSVEYLARHMANASIVDMPSLGHAMLRSSHDKALVGAILLHLDITAEQEVA